LEFGVWRFAPFGAGWIVRLVRKRKPRIFGGMRTLFVLIVGIVIGAAGMHYYLEQPQSTAAATGSTGSTRQAADGALARTRAAASDVSDRVAEKMREWKLTPADIRADLAKTGQVARENAARARDKVSDARIVTVIKAKFVLDRELSANAIEVTSKDGDVTLTGTVTAEPLIGKAVAHALDTDGVQHVTSKITVRS
jgi:lambda repressor-like predicted transcriptional regulator